MRTLLVASAISGAVLFFLGAVVGYARADAVWYRESLRASKAQREQAEEAWNLALSSAYPRGFLPR